MGAGGGQTKALELLGYRKWYLLAFAFPRCREEGWKEKGREFVVVLFDVIEEEKKKNSKETRTTTKKNEKKRNA